MNIFTKNIFDQGCNQEFFRAGEVSWNNDTSINISSVTLERKVLQGKISEFFFLCTLKKAFQMGNLTHRRSQSRHIFSKSGHFFEFSKKGKGRSLLTLLVTDL